MSLEKKFVADKLKNELILQIENSELNTNSKILSERQLAKKYQLSYMTIRRAITCLVSAGYLYKEPGRGIFVDSKWRKTLANSPTKTNKIIMLIVQDMSNIFMLKLLAITEELLHEIGYNLLVCNSKLDINREAVHLDKALKMNIAGIFLYPCAPPNNQRKVQKIIDSGIPLIQLDRYFENLNADYVTPNNYETAQKALEYLIMLGHKKIAHITRPVRNLSSINERLKGYLDTLKKYNLICPVEYLVTMDESKVYIESDKVNLNYLGYWEAKRLLTLADPPTAIFMVCDDLYFGVIRAVNEYKLKIPDDLSIIGVNDSQFSRDPSISLTTMGFSQREIIQEAIKILEKRLLNPDAPVAQVKIPSRLLIRKSCQPPTNH